MFFCSDFKFGVSGFKGRENKRIAISSFMFHVSRKRKKGVIVVSIFEVSRGKRGGGANKTKHKHKTNPNQTTTKKAVFFFNDGLDLFSKNVASWSCSFFNGA